MRHFLALRDMDRKELFSLIKNGIEIKKHPKKYANKMKGKNLLMIFEAPSLRTRLSFEIGMNQMGGHAVYYSLSESTLGKKESVKEFARVVSRYVDMMTARIYDQKMVEEMAGYSEVPVINAMTNQEHPCQVLSDLMTIWEKKKSFNLKLAYLGDGLNNVTHSLLYGCSLVGMDISVATPQGKEYEPDQGVVSKAKKFALVSGSKIFLTDDPKAAVKDADIIYTDSWMSYRIPKDREPERTKALRPYQVNKKLMSKANPDAIFMHCLPAKRGHEVTDDVIDSRQSVIFDQAENRLHAQKAILISLIRK